jgi:GTPase
MFVDHIFIHARAGDGGNGSSHLARLAFKPRGGPDGGDGGDGGDVILEVSPHCDNLRTFFYDPKVFAESGKAGMRQNKSGRAGRDKVVAVPPGTLVWRANAATPAEAAQAYRAEDGSLELEPVADLVGNGQRFVLARGGKGGRGNTRFKTSVNRAPEGEPGTPGEEGVFFLELRMIADVGLVGFPNAGKSTLVSKLSHARPKIAAYPFTTLEPMVGVMEYEGWRRATVADIPGLIEGASENVGLGHEFLRHIQRCRLLLFVVDTAGSEGRDPVADLRQLRAEVGLYDRDLAARPWMIAANKLDLEGAREGLAAIRAAFPKQEIHPLSAAAGDGVAALKARLGEQVATGPAR